MDSIDLYDLRSEFELDPRVRRSRVVDGTRPEDTLLVEFNPSTAIPHGPVLALNGVEEYPNVLLGVMYEDMDDYRARSKDESEYDCRYDFGKDDWYEKGVLDLIGQCVREGWDILNPGSGTGRALDAVFAWLDRRMAETRKRMTSAGNDYEWLKDGERFLVYRNTREHMRELRDSDDYTLRHLREWSLEHAGLAEDSMNRLTMSGVAQDSYAMASAHTRMQAYGLIADRCGTFETEEEEDKRP